MATISSKTFKRDNNKEKQAIKWRNSNANVYQLKFGKYLNNVVIGHESIGFHV
jgi:hypothetical protein